MREGKENRRARGEGHTDPRKEESARGQRVFEKELLYLYFISSFASFCVTILPLFL